MSEYFSWIWFYPIILTFMTYMACNKEIFERIDLTCDYTDPSLIIVFFFSGTGLCFALGSEITLSLFF